MTGESSITALHAKLQQAIRAIEGSDSPSHDQLADAEARLIELFELIKLFLISERDSYYGYFFMTLRLHPNVHCRNIAGVKLNEYPPVLETNPLLLGKFSLKEIIYIICHEIDHILYNHPAEMARLDPDDSEEIYERFNLAADASVNDGLNHEETNGAFYMHMPAKSITSLTLKEMFGLANILPHESYLYYFNLIRNLPHSKHANHGKQGMLKSRGQTDGSTGASGNPRGLHSANSGQEHADEANIITTQVCQAPEDHDWGINDPEEALYAVRETINAAAALMDSETRGRMPPCFKEQIKRINEPPRIPWQSLLKKYIGTISSGKRKTRTRLNRRQPDRFDLSGSVSDATLKIVVAIDTSGSMSPNELASVFNEIFAILAHRSYEITVIECDCEIQRVYQVRKPSDVMLDICGRGGTEFTPVINYINNQHYFRDALLVYFTDGYGESKIPRPHTYRNLWIILGECDALSIKEPYGSVVSLR